MGGIGDSCGRLRAVAAAIGILLDLIPRCHYTFLEFAKVVPGISEALGANLDDDRCSRCASLEQVMRELNRPQRGVNLGLPQ